MTNTSWPSAEEIWNANAEIRRLQELQRSTRRSPMPRKSGRKLVETSYILTLNPPAACLAVAIFLPPIVTLVVIAVVAVVGG